MQNVIAKPIPHNQIESNTAIEAEAVEAAGLKRTIRDTTSSDRFSIFTFRFNPGNKKVKLA